MLVIKENWLSGAADRAQQARRGHGFHTEPSIIPHPVFGLLFGRIVVIGSKLVSILVPHSFFGS